ncbi:unnamed protein product [Adineta ricciae]|uniref:Alpha-L-rhamnosidase six-hairpin glycosidase domain-containing protein n=1 Tax=Adineta ricciae TaxID=249248 RepID=A0A815H2V0_ADIRI|nr:unnamed protein product [Adineta ricciae]CAF1346700.1 unnamed protein product [Adineta ricciae]
MLFEVVIFTLAVRFVSAGKCPGQAYSTPFNSSSPILTRQLNVFWSIYGTCEEKLDTNDNPFGDNPAWAEWDAIKFSWNNHNGYRDHAQATLSRFPINGIDGTIGNMSDGFIWSWMDSERWPDARGSHGSIASYHFDQLPRFPAAVYQYYAWTRNRTFLQTILPRVEFVMTYLLVNMNGSYGIPINRVNDGTPEASRPSTYMDQVKSGWKDTWVTMTFYTALTSMVELEKVVGNYNQMKFYQTLVNNFGEIFDGAFWNESLGRYVGWVDRNGYQHDSGYVFINLEALARGLGNRTKADRIFQWLSEPADPIGIGPHNGSTDVYHNVLAARTTTKNVAQPDWDGWSDPDEGRRPYGGLVESGGTMIWLTYYDIMARLRFNHTDEAFAILTRMLDRVDNDSHCLTFNYEKGRPQDDFGEDFVQIGSNFPFPESGIAVVAFLHGFVGVQAKTDGLYICPQLPSSLDFVQAQVDYDTSRLTIQISKQNASTIYHLIIPEQQLSVDIIPGACYNLSFDSSE